MQLQSQHSCGKMGGGDKRIHRKLRGLEHTAREQKPDVEAENTALKTVL